MTGTVVTKTPDISATLFFTIMGVRYEVPVQVTSTEFTPEFDEISDHAFTAIITRRTEVVICGYIAPAPELG